MKKSFIIICSLLFANGIFAQNIDINLLRDINIHRNKSLDGTFKLITNSADPVSIAEPVSVISVALIKNDKALLHKGIYVGASWLSSVIISTAAKHIVNRDRPFVTYPEIEKLTEGGSPSFPSGHTTVAFATATSLSIAFPKWYVIAPSYLWAGLVGYSRMHLGVHYPSDIGRSNYRFRFCMVMLQGAEMDRKQKEKKPYCKQ